MTATPATMAKQVGEAGLVSVVVTRCGTSDGRENVNCSFRASVVTMFLKEKRKYNVPK